MKKISVDFKNNGIRSEKQQKLYSFLLTTFSISPITFIGYLDDNGLPCGDCLVSFEGNSSKFEKIKFKMRDGEFCGKATALIADKNDKFSPIYYDFISPGQGQITYPNKKHYVGGIKHFVRNGLGRYTNDVGFSVVGKFQSDKLDGLALHYDEKGCLYKASTWKRGELISEQTQLLDFIVPAQYFDNKTKDNLEKKTSNDKQPENQEKSINKNLKFNVLIVKKMINNISNSIVGQKKAIDEITNNLIIQLLCDRDQNKPISSMIFTGPTGVGKTEMAKQISQHIFGTRPFVVDFANFNNDAMLSSLIGSSVGYVGSDQEPEFLKFIKEHQDTGGVILFEEIDKADTKCFNIFMRMLDEGEVLSAKNIPYKVNNMIIISTTNMTENYSHKLGFRGDSENQLKQSIANSLTGMKMEQLARFDLVVEFESLTKEDRYNITKIALNDAISKIKTINNYSINVTYDDSLIADIANSADKSFGVREIKRKASEIITKSISKQIKETNDKEFTIKLVSLDEVEIIKKAKELENDLFK